MTIRSAQALGLCVKAGKLITGFDAVMREAAKGQKAVSGIAMASDISKKTEKEVMFYAGKYAVPAMKIDATMEQILTVIKKRTGVFAVTDEGLYKMLTSYKPIEDNNKS